MNFTRKNIISFIQNICTSFEEVMKSKDITFNFESNTEGYSIVFDLHKVEIILFNLLSNAYKFTPAKGTIYVRCVVDEQTNVLKIEVEDSGRKIDLGKNQNVFGRFNIFNTEDRQEIYSSGIGLSLVKEFMSLHKGYIRVENTARGNIFTLIFDTYANLETINNESEFNASPDYINEYIDTIADQAPIMRPLNRTQPIIFVVFEDNHTVKFISSLLDAQYNVISYSSISNITAEIEVHQPVLIIVGMEHKDSDMYCDFVTSMKNERATKHIAIAVIGDSDKEAVRQRVYSSGADAYVSRPFEGAFLTKRVEYILNNRQSIEERIKHRFITAPKDIVLQSADDIFLNKAREYIEKNIADENLSVTMFAKNMSLSTSMFYKRIKSITGQSPVEFIRSFRLKRAAQLLVSNSLSVSEVAYKVGFSDVRYFSTCFRRAFGKTPSQHKNS